MLKIALLAGSLTLLAAPSSFADEQTIEGVGLGRKLLARPAMSGFTVPKIPSSSRENAAMSPSMAFPIL